MNYQATDPVKEAEAFLNSHFHQGDAIPHLAMLFGAFAGDFQHVLKLDLTARQFDRIQQDIANMHTGLQICVKLNEIAELVPKSVKHEELKHG